MTESLVEQRALPFAIPADAAPVPAPRQRPAATRRIKPPEIVRAEANFLRFPFFALHTKGLRQRDGVECVGRKRDGDRVHVFKLSMTRNTKHLYPGPLSRKAHVAILSLQQERGFPFQNPVEWSWPQLTERMGITCGGEIQAKLMDAIRRTAGVLITTNYALTTVIGKERHLLPSDEHGYHLYDGYRFRNERLHDGTLADRNCVWLSEWYMTNLNSLYSGPLHHPTWLALDAESSIASRLYEFLLFNAKATETLRIDYATLCNFLPVKLERYPSDAERQLAEPFALARREGVIDDATWTLGSKGQMQLVIRFGPKLRDAPASERSRAADWPDFAEDVEIRELRNTDTPAADLAREFHRLWSGNQNYRPLKSELALAEELMERYGRKRLQDLLPKVVRAMQGPGGFPTAKMFTATRGFFGEIAGHDAEEHERRERERTALRSEQAETARVLDRKHGQAARRDELRKAWDALLPDARARIERAACERQNGAALRELFKTSESHRHRECLKELDRQTGEVLVP